MSYVGESIKKRRKELKLTQEELAELTNSSQSKINKLENGKVYISLDDILSLTKALNLGKNELFHCYYYDYYKDNANEAFQSIYEKQEKSFSKIIETWNGLIGQEIMLAKFFKEKYRLLEDFFVYDIGIDKNEFNFQFNTFCYLLGSMKYNEDMEEDFVLSDNVLKDVLQKKMHKYMYRAFFYLEGNIRVSDEQDDQMEEHYVSPNNEKWLEIREILSFFTKVGDVSLFHKDYCLEMSRKNQFLMEITFLKNFDFYEDVEIRDLEKMKICEKDIILDILSKLFFQSCDLNYLENYYSDFANHYHIIFNNKSKINFNDLSFSGKEKAILSLGNTKLIAMFQRVVEHKPTKTEKDKKYLANWCDKICKQAILQENDISREDVFQYICRMDELKNY